MPVGSDHGRLFVRREGHPKLAELPTRLFELPTEEDRRRHELLGEDAQGSVGDLIEHRVESARQLARLGQVALHEVHGLEADEGLAERSLVVQSAGKLLRTLHEWNGHLHISIRLKDAPSVAERYPKLEGVATSALGRPFEGAAGTLEVLGGFVVAALSGCTFACKEVGVRGLHGDL